VKKDRDTWDSGDKWTREKALDCHEKKKKSWLEENERERKGTGTPAFFVGPHTYTEKDVALCWIFIGSQRTYGDPTDHFLLSAFAKSKTVLTNKLKEQTVPAHTFSPPTLPACPCRRSPTTVSTNHLTPLSTRPPFYLFFEDSSRAVNRFFFSSTSSPTKPTMHGDPNSHPTQFPLFGYQSLAIVSFVSSTTTGKSSCSLPSQFSFFLHSLEPDRPASRLSNSTYVLLRYLINCQTLPHKQQ
jgi:hypothetical protein